MTLAEVTAAAAPLQIAGQTYFLSVLRAKDWGEAARVLNLRRRRPLEIVKDHLAGLSIDQQAILLELAYKDERAGEFLPIEDVQRWFRTPEGRAYKWWLMVRGKHPAMTLEQAEDLLVQSALEEDERERQLLSAAAQTTEARAARMEREAEGMPSANPTQSPAAPATVASATEGPVVSPVERSPGG